MIDEKKIQEAAAGKFNVGGLVNTVERIAFKEGVEWFKKALWHDASEIPEKGNALALRDIAELADTLVSPWGRKYTLNFALADDSIIDGKVLASMFDPRKFMCKITPLHRTNSCEANHIQTSGGYDSFVPYKKVEEDLKANGFDVIVFVPSYDEDNGLITCGNAILSGKKPTSSYKEVIF